MGITAAATAGLTSRRNATLAVRSLPTIRIAAGHNRARIIRRNVLTQRLHIRSHGVIPRREAILRHQHRHVPTLHRVAAVPLRAIHQAAVVAAMAEAAEVAAAAADRLTAGVSPILKLSGSTGLAKSASLFCWPSPRATTTGQLGLDPRETLRLSRVLSFWIREPQPGSPEAKTRWYRERKPSTPSDGRSASSN
jgi:hypothetical protein